MKRKHLLATFAVLATLTATAGFVACDDKKPAADNPLPAPEITATNDGIYWSEVQSAKEYRYKWNEDGSWKKTKTCEVEYPTTVGSYTLFVEALSSSGKAGRTTEFDVDVATYDVTCEQVDNTFVFTGESIYYSVNGGEETKLDDSLVLDFTAGSVGTTYSVEYYTKGGAWVAEEETYYIDGAKATVSLTVTKMLSAPVLEVNAEGTGLVWTADSNATTYEVIVDGVRAEVSASEASVAFPTTVGAHVIQARALTNGSWTASREAEFSFETKEFGVPEVSFNQQTGNITWDEKYNGWMEVAVDGVSFELATENRVAFADGTKVRLVSGFDKDANVYYLASKTLGIAQREMPTVSFDNEGVLSWNASDEGVQKTYFVSLETSGENFGASAVNSLNVSGEKAGQYVFKVYAGQYLDEGTTSATLYLPSEVTTFTFGVLEAPELDYEVGKLLWTTDINATSYEYKIDDGNWIPATEVGFVEVTNLATYAVRALGREDGPYYVSSKPVTLRFDPNMPVDSLGYRTLASFDEAGYSTQIAGPLQTANLTPTGTGAILTEGANAAEQAILDGASGGVMKLTAGTSGGRNQNLWGNSDGVSLELFKGIQPKAGAQIVVRLYMVSNEARQTAWSRKVVTDPDTGEKYIQETPRNAEGQIVLSLVGPNKTTAGTLYAWEAWSTIETDKWVDFIFDLGNVYLMSGNDQWGTYRDGVTEVKYVNVMFQNNGKEGDAIYVDSIKYIDKAPSVNMREFDFESNPEYIKAFSLQAKTKLATVEKDGRQKQVASIQGYWRGDGYWSLNFNDIVLASGSKISFDLWIDSQSDAGAGIYINGAWKKDVPNNGEWTTYVITVGEKTTLQSLDIFGYKPSNAYNFYLDNIKIEGSIVVTNYLTIDFEKIGGVTDNVSVYHGDNASGGYVNNDISYDETEKALKVSNYRIYGGSTAKGIFFNYPTEGEDAIKIVAGMTFTLVAKAEFVDTSLTEGASIAWAVNGTQNTKNGAFLNDIVAITGGVSEGYVTLTLTIKEGSALVGQTLSNIYVYTYITNHKLNFYIQSLVITMP